MSLPDPVDTFRQEARELLEQLEASLLDLEQDTQNSELINSAFRALRSTTSFFSSAMTWSYR